MSKQSFECVNVRLPTELAEMIDKVIELEKESTGIKLDRSKIVRRAIEEDCKRRLINEI